MSGGVSPIYKGLGGLKTRRPEGAKVPANAEPLVKSMEDACTYHWVQGAWPTGTLRQR